MENQTKENKYSFPVEQTLSKEYLKENFWKCLYTSCENQLHYWVILPNNVNPTKLEPIMIDGLNMVNIGQYTRIDGSPYLEVQFAYEHSLFEMNASDWLKNKLAKMGEEILEERIIHGKSTGDYMDCLCRKQMNDGANVISRYTVIKDYDIIKSGANLICIKATCQEKNYEELALTIFQIVSNWDLSNKSDWQMAELLNPFMIDFIEPVKFFIPYSWEITVKKGKEKSHFIFEHKIENKNKGVINALFYELTNFKTPIELLKQNIQRFYDSENIHLNLYDLNKVAYSEFNNPSIAELFHTEGLIQEENFKAYIIINIIKTNKGWYYFEGIGPRPNFQNFYWEINKRAIELIINSFNNLDFKKIQEKPNNYIKKQKNYYKIINGKKYTQAEWEKFDKEEFENYARKNNISVEENKSYKRGKFFLDEKESNV